MLVFSPLNLKFCKSLPVIGLIENSNFPVGSIARQAHATHAASADKPMLPVLTYKWGVCRGVPRHTAGTPARSMPVAWQSLNKRQISFSRVFILGESRIGHSNHTLATIRLAAIYAADLFFIIIIISSNC